MHVLFQYTYDASKRRDLVDDYGRFLLHGRLDFIPLDYTKVQAFAGKTRLQRLCLQTQKWSLSRKTFPNFTGVRVLQQCLYNVLCLRSQIVPERRLQTFISRLAFLSTERTCQALQRFRTVSRLNRPLTSNILRFYSTLGETSITGIDTVLLLLTKSCSCMIQVTRSSLKRLRNP